MKIPFLSLLHSSRYLVIFAVISGTFLIAQSCQKWVRPDNEPGTSTWGDDESVDDDHQYNGYNCMNCHYTEGRGEGWFSVAGTIFGNPGNAMVRIYKDVNQPPIKEIEVDAHGNFYITEDVDFSEGVFASTVDVNGQEEFMNQKINSGQCSLCHGVSTDKLSF